MGQVALLATSDADVRSHVLLFYRSLNEKQCKIGIVMFLKICYCFIFLKFCACLRQLTDPLEDNSLTFYAPNFEKVGDILVSACPYVRTYVFMFEISS